MRITTENETLTAYLSGEIDHHSAKGMREEIDQTALRYKPKTMVLDFKDVAFMDSSGIGLVMGRYALIKESGAVLRLANVSAYLKKVMRLSGLDKIAEID